MERNNVSIFILRLSLRSFSIFLSIYNHSYPFESQSFYPNLSPISFDLSRYAAFHFSQENWIINIIW